MAMTPKILLQGAWYAFEQCGILLRDAVTLYERGSRATAVGLAMLAREELGKARILLDFWSDAMNKRRRVSAAEVRSKLDNHEEKQRRAAISQFWNESGATGTSALLRAITSSPDVAAREAASEELERLSKRRQKRTP